ncbi:nucleotidyltransferase domain-containing protein [Roseateles oligotrophus]|uniref:Nucleotidyltransferase family protein n=1 Tax=Roseateles oligotrophus TaxID=1769250 RepID=A0ABT2YD79_9BURK|nr:nucleotidyltransferase family protein [Roseateles oligotrophus]MCV2368002.1 nucleotidyltransferase family protein [Roseateles oligotrophus]
MSPIAAQPYLLTATLRQPERARRYGTRDWERLVWQSRAAELMAQLHLALDAADVLRLAPAEAQRHLNLAAEIAARHASAVQSELRELQEALHLLDVPVLLLKGAAYCVLANPASIGRIFNDIDILVPKLALPGVEQHLTWAGWHPSNTNAYDERYYREWMHEIPPMEHKNRATVLDVHFTILPPTSGIRPNPQDLFDSALQLPGEWSFFRVLAPTDMVIHSACHLFFGEFHKGLRDLYDLHRLLSDFSARAEFWPGLVARAQHLRLGLPLLDALQQCRRLYETQIPDDVIAVLQAQVRSPWPRFMRAWIFEHALRPAHASAFGPSTRLAHWMVFVRSHWLRMPLPLLAYHLAHKALFAQ